MKPDRETLREHITATYFSLRLGIVLFAVALPIVLYVVGRLSGIPLRPSMSDYYPHGTEATRDWFVGTLFAVGAILYAYKGYSDLENISLNLAGLLAIGVALFPCRCGDETAMWSPHGAFAVSFFVVIAFVAVKCGPDTLPLIGDSIRRERFRHLYRIIGAVMLLSPLIAVGVSLTTRQFSNVRFFVEAFGVYTFAFYWLVKSRELRETDADGLAVKGQAVQTPRGVVKAPSPVTVP